jgi:urea ABC transporter urea binding protein
VRTDSTIRVGVLHSLTGTMASDEKHLAAAAQMAIDEVNESGGVLGKQVEVVLRDGASDPAVFADKARELLSQEDIVTIFGCWTSSSRKAVKPIVEEYNSLLWYPVQYEGLEQSANIIYTGSCLNQQISPAVDWALAQGKRRCFLVGSDYVYPRTANSLIRTLFSQEDRSVLGERYVPLGSHDFAEVAGAIAKARPDIVFNTINGDGNLAFFREYERVVGNAGGCPTMSFSFSETELLGVVREGGGHYACWSYFQTLDTPENNRFFKKYTRRFGSQAVVSDPIATAYTQVYLWKQAVERANSFGARDVVSNSAGCSVTGPGGVMELQSNHHVSKHALIGQANPEGQFDVIWSSQSPIEPKPWLGVEDIQLPTRNLIVAALSQYPEVVHLNVTLENRVRQRTAELEQANESLRLDHARQADEQNDRLIESERLRRMLLSILEDREQAEEAMRQSEDKYRRLAESTEAILWEYDISSDRWTYVAPQCERILGYQPEEWTNLQFWVDHIHQEDRDSTTKYCADCTARGESHEFEYRFQKKDGNVIWLRDVVTVITRDELPVAMRGFKVDITARKLAEEDRERLMTAIGQAAEVVVITDAKGTIQYVNPAFERITGYTPEEAVGQNPRILKSGEHDEIFYREMWDTLIGGQPWSGRFINKKKDGTLYTEEAVISPVVNASGTTVNYVAVKRDITEEIKMESQYRQAQKMEAVGRLAAGVAHDFNNQLQVILGYCDMLMMDRQPGDPLWDPIVQVRQAADRARSTTSHLLAFSRRQLLEPELVDVAELLHDMEKPVGRMIGEDVKLVIAVPPGVRPLLIDKSGLHQAIMNLAVNARDAMSDGGKLVIQSSNVTIDHAHAADFPEAQPGDYVLLEVIDSGVGMDAETLEHLFEPFFTTKEQGKGTGLGMPMVQGFVGQSEGFIRIDSQPGKGTAVRILLPQAPSDLQSGKTDQTPPRIEKVPEGVTIMIVEDEQGVRSFLARLLERIGYSVLTAAMPSEALELIQGDYPRPDLVISDVIMPEMRGDQLAEKMQLIDESLRFLFISGYGNIDVGGHDIIRKPFKSEDMLERVKKILL